MYVWRANRRIARLLSRGRREGACLIWTGPVNRSGYVQVSWKGKMRYLHVVVYELAHGPVPEGKEVDHTCRRRACFETSHLEAVTHQENVLRGDTLPAANAKKTSCPKGHPLDDANTYRAPGAPTKRRCLICSRANARDSWRRRHPMVTT